MLGDLRTAADFVGGEKAVKEFNASLKEKLGAKGFEGLDINQPIVGYVILAPKPEDITAVIVLPITGEKEFLALCDRANSVKHKDLGKGLYELPPLDPRYKARMRFSDGHAYIAYGAKPEPASTRRRSSRPASSSTRPRPPRSPGSSTSTGSRPK